MKAPEYWYRLLMRPASEGFPRNGFLRYEIDETKYGLLVYDRKLDAGELSHFDLETVTNVGMYDGMNLCYYIDGNDRYMATVSFTEFRGRKVAHLSKKDLDGHILEVEAITVNELMRLIEAGELSE